ncbi:sensor histidine kinase [Egicoccus sp. AB-alg6-2]|uniref:sensor histidine kinase n=1 Tax=Egicoccus sp. AB-alg6-2 TaxID=3242692 RepID=UPI00359CBB96
MLRAWWPVPLVLVLDQITPGMAGVGTLAPLPAALFSLGHAVPLRWRGTRPVLVAAAVVSTSLLQALSTGPTLAFGSWVALMVAVFAVANGARRAVAAGTLAGVLAVVGIIAALTEPEAPLVDAVFPIVYFGGAWAAGRLVRSRRLAAVRLAALADSLAREREETARLAVAAARGRMSREVHDIVAHSLGIIVLQAEAADALLERDAAAVRRPLTIIQDTGRQALDELRRMLDLLGADDGTSPLPGLVDVPDLVAGFVRVGLPVALEVNGDLDAAPPGLGLTVYRLVQESLTNVLKHTDAAGCTVAVTVGPALVEVVVADTGPRRSDGPAVTGSGRGLVGMRERVESFDGELLCGPTADGGFEVTARLPLVSEAVV